ncbi:MAG: histidine--tRNA ligase, partial [Clostridiales bacterium]|nr:histidine--tRNA ligase [Clostridiales bacterium]
SQFGLECFGSPSSSVDAELILFAYNLIKEFQIKNIQVYINSIGCPICRPAYLEKLKEYISQHKEGLCKDCQTRYEKNPLRVLDCKKDSCKRIMAHAPSMLDMLCEECADHFQTLQTYLLAAKIPYTVDNRIVRGLDYYTKTVFELITKTDTGEITVCGGGRYDGLVEQLGGPSLPAAGFGMGMERLLMVLEKEKLLPPAPNMVDIFIATIGEEGKTPAFLLTNDLRLRGFRSECDHMNRSLKAQFKYANKIGVKIMAILGEEELKNEEITLRNMMTKEEVRVPQQEAATLISRWMEEKRK